MSTITPTHLEPRFGELYTHTAIRGVAALCVVGYHAMLGATGKAAAGNPVADFFLSSFLFVDFFFILSGFIMSESYGEKIEKSGLSISIATNYYKKRALKILPNYYFWLLLSVAFWALSKLYFGGQIKDFNCVSLSILQHVLLVQNLIGSCLYFNTPLWSIAVECLTYLAFPLIVALRPRALILLAAALMLYANIFFYSSTIDIIEGKLSAARCLAGFLCGMAMARFQRRTTGTNIHIALLAALVIAISTSLELVSIIIMAVLTLTTAQNTGAVAAFSRLKVPYAIGRASFSIYLAHIPVSMVVSPIAYKIEAETGIPFGSDWTYSLPTKIILSVLVGIWAYGQVESRLADLSRRSQRTSWADDKVVT